MELQNLGPARYCPVPASQRQIFDPATDWYSWMRKCWADSFALKILVCFLATLTFLNCLFTDVMFRVVYFGNMEFYPDHVKFNEVDLDKVRIGHGLIQGFSNTSLEIVGEAGSTVQLGVRRGSQLRPLLSIGNNFVGITGVDNFHFLFANGTKSLCSDLPTLPVPKGATKLSVPVATTNRVMSLKNSDLHFVSSGNTKILAEKLVNLEGDNVVIQAFNDIILSVKTSLVMEGKAGIVINIDTMPVYADFAFTEETQTFHKDKEMQYVFQLCLCEPGRKLFFVKVGMNKMDSENRRIGCHSVKKNPCQNSKNVVQK